MHDDRTYLVEQKKTSKVVKRKRFKVWLFTLFSMLLALGSYGLFDSLSFRAMASVTPSVEPRLALRSSHQIVETGQKIQVAVWIENVRFVQTPLIGFQVRLKYDPKQLQLVPEESVWYEKAIFGATKDVQTYSRDIKANQGILELAQSLSPQSLMTEGFRGYGKIGQFTFIVTEQEKGKEIEIQQDKSLLIVRGHAGKNIKHLNNTLVLKLGKAGDLSSADSSRYFSWAGEDLIAPNDVHQHSFSSLSHFKDQKAIQSVPWAQEALNRLAAEGILTGYADGSLLPQKSVTRAEFATMLVKTLGVPMVQSHEHHFVDVVPSHWAFDYIETAYQNGWILGIEKKGERYFEPNRSLTRAEMAALIANLIQPKGADVGQRLNHPFLDVTSVPWAEKSIALLYQENIISGKDQTHYDPSNVATRAEISVVTTRILDWLNKQP